VKTGSRQYSADAAGAWRQPLKLRWSRFLLASASDRVGFHSPNTKGTNGPSDITAINNAAAISSRLSLRSCAICLSCLIDAKQFNASACD
jgi:hypothetical protein